jgi:serine/threonine protein kinase
MFYIKSLGSGSFGVIDLYQKDDGQYMVVKKLKCHHHYQSGYRMFKNECRILSKLVHPNIRKIYDFTAYTMTLEYCQGLDMFDYLQSIELDYDMILPLFMQLVDAVHYIHSKNIAHLDIKLENIMIDPAHKKLTLIDFGHAIDTKMISKLGGTHPYIAPEGFDKNPQISINADIWSLGIILYEFIHNTIPWEYSNEVDPAFVCYSKTGNIILKDDLPDNFKSLLDKMLTIDPIERITSDGLLSQLLEDKYKGFKAV